jgi:WD40 repeat protein
VSDTGSGLTQNEMCSYDRAHGDAEVNCVSWCPRLRMNGVLASAGDDGTVNIWKVVVSVL